MTTAIEVSGTFRVSVWFLIFIPQIEV